MRRESLPTTGAVLLLWIVACAVSWELGWNLGRVAQLQLGIADTKESYPLLAVAAAVRGAVIGIALGVAQWFFISARVGRSLRSVVPATALGGAVGQFAGIHSSLLVSGAVFYVLAGAVFGFAVGLFQWIAMRRELGRSIAWISGNALGAAVAAPLQFAAFDAGIWFPYAVGGAVYALATGPVLLRLRHSSIAEQDPVARCRF